MLNFGFLGGLGNFISTNCFTPLVLLTDGSYGYDSSQVITGTLVPDTASDSTFIYKYHMTTAGVFIVAFGVAGDEQLANTDLVVYTHASYGQVELFWDSVNEYYTGTNLSLATDIIAGDIGVESCYTSELEVFLACGEEVNCTDSISCDTLTVWLTDSSGVYLVDGNNNYIKA